MAATSDSSFREWRVGMLVDVKGHGHATIIEDKCIDTNSPVFGRHRVQYEEDGSTFWVTEKRMRPIKQARKRVVVCYRTAEYRQAAIANAHARDVVLEIGCHAGVTTHMMSKRTSWVAGIDLTPSVVEVARTKFPGLLFEAMDGADTAAAMALLPPLHRPCQEQQELQGGEQQALAQAAGCVSRQEGTEGHSSEGVGCQGDVTRGVAAGEAIAVGGVAGGSDGGSGGQGFTKVLIDISGQAPLCVLVPILRAWLEAAPAATLVVKNRALHRYMDAYERRHGGYKVEAAGMLAGEEVKEGGGARGTTAEDGSKHHGGQELGAVQGHGLQGDGQQVNEQEQSQGQSLSLQQGQQLGQGQGQEAGQQQQGQLCQVTEHQEELCEVDPLDDPSQVSLMAELEELVEVFRERSSCYDKQDAEVQRQLAARSAAIAAQVEAQATQAAERAEAKRLRRVARKAAAAAVAQGV